MRGDSSYHLGFPAQKPRLKIRVCAENGEQGTEMDEYRTGGSICSESCHRSSSLSIVYI